MCPRRDQTSWKLGSFEGQHAAWLSSVFDYTKQKNQFNTMVETPNSGQPFNCIGESNLVLPDCPLFQQKRRSYLARIACGVFWKLPSFLTRGFLGFLFVMKSNSLFPPQSETQNGQQWHLPAVTLTRQLPDPPLA